MQKKFYVPIKFEDINVNRHQKFHISALGDFQKLALNRNLQNLINEITNEENRNYDYITIMNSCQKMKQFSG